MIHDQLKKLISQSVKTLGQAIKEIHGKDHYREIDKVRLRMKKCRGKEAAYVEQRVNELYHDLNQQNDKNLGLIAKSFSLMLELINACESAFRIHRLENYQINDKQGPEAIIYVFTSHPTESRSAPYLKLMKQIEPLLLEALQSDFKLIEKKLLYLLQLAVRIDIANNKRPQVKDEMHQIFQTVLTPDLLSEQIYLAQREITVSFRTWVGGDKDGHPKVNDKTMLQSLQRSREHLIRFLSKKINTFEAEFSLLQEGSLINKKIKGIKLALNSIKKIKNSDGVKVLQLRKNIEELISLSEKNKVLSPLLLEIETLFWLYPALVLPLEIREDSAMIHDALKKRNAPITLMLRRLKDISKGHDSKWYVRGFIVSMCMSSKDYLAAIELTEKTLGKLGIPVVPLFENEKGLKEATSILRESMKQHPFPEIHKKNWGSRFEVMVGYSDSSKENGVLPSRLMVEEAIFEIEDFLKKKKLKPVFFHGSGGSTSRGGGSVEEQIAWWPQSALDRFKVTIQGEMVQRNFSNHLLMRSQVSKIIKSYHKVKTQGPHHHKSVNDFSKRVQIEYRELVNNPDFQELTKSATPYQYLNLLRIGSRPSKRQSSEEFSLRAIPWVLCWTQTRLLLPMWWGTGSAWEAFTNEEKMAFKRACHKSPLLQSYIKNLGFIFARIEFGIWNFHLNKSGLSPEDKKYWKSHLENEFQKSVRFFHEVSEEKDFTWFRPWLGESIYFRSSMIHPLNVIQKIALEREDHILLRETVTGIACGMLTTG